MNRYLVVDLKDNEYLDYFDYLDNVYGSISECLEMFESIITDEEKMSDILKEIKVNIANIESELN